MTIATMLLGILGCQQDAEPGGRPDTQMRDSAGIRIVENARPTDGSRLDWRIGPEPEVSIGVLEGDDPYMLFAVRDATILSDGRIVVVNTERPSYGSSTRRAHIWIPGEARAKGPESSPTSGA